MPSLSFKLALTTVTATISLAGCNGSWRPGLEQTDQISQKKEVTLSDYLRANRIGFWAYQRKTIPPEKDQPITTYTRTASLVRFSEGVLANRPFSPLSRYLVTPVTSPASQPTPIIRPAAPFPKEGMSIFIELQKPMEPIPEDLQPANPVSNTTAIRYYDHQGRVQAKGMLTREVEIEGYED
ncbi:MAG: hypothetical protein JSV03_10150, partial [Planctomycetota bacterium]